MRAIIPKMFYKDGTFLRIKATREVVKCHLYYVLTNFFRIISIVSKGLGIGNHYEYFVELPRILQFNPSFQRTYIVPQMEPACRSVAGKYNFFHKW